ncbi:MAG: chromosome segregation protein ScpA [Desulfobacterium sp.]|nr:chromosome segregation protein ScpA [Desulfobacterium sp.]MBU3948875.1 segregation/condensation protein A [Pseudomonadota bacterium]MBU4036865.1 segregation/condensation protein A [Pseudomonadota bacterium]
MSEEPEEIYEVHLKDIFEGPMDLLIHLIKKNEVDIYDIPIALITDKYLQYIDWMKSMNVNVAGDFLVMAATLTHIKSKMLLPIQEEDEDDPRIEITRPLLEYLQMKSAAEHLLERDILGENTFSRSLDRKDLALDNEDRVINVGLFELMDAFQRLLDKIPAFKELDVSPAGASVKDKINELLDILEKEGSVTFDQLFDKNSTKSEFVITFLAILEMVRLAIISIVQHVQSGIIRLFYL